MGGYYSAASRKLGADIISDSDDLVIDITIHTANHSPNLIPIMDYLQRTRPMLSYCYCKTIYLLYCSKRHHLATNITGDLISMLASEITAYAINNHICDPYYVEISISRTPFELARSQLLTIIRDNNYFGKMHGINILSEDKINEQFLSKDK